MARFVVANRHSGKLREQEKEDSRGEVAGALQTLSGFSIVSDSQPTAGWKRRVTVVEADPNEIAAKKGEFPDDVIIEPEIFYDRATRIPILPPAELADAIVLPGLALPAAGTFSSVQISVTAEGAPLANATVTAYVRAWGQAKALEPLGTDDNGICDIPVPNGHELSAVLVVPAGGYWSMVARGMELYRPIDCPPLPDGQSLWWRRKADLSLGKGISVGVIDTGVGNIPALDHVVREGAYIDTAFNASAEDVDSHGSHVCGIIGARSGYIGIAPGCDLHAVRVFRDDKTGASNADIVKALDHLSLVRRLHLVNMSLGGPYRSELVREAIAAAQQAGTLCICAAGNSAGRVIFPAAYPEAVAVTALGLAGWAPPGSLAASRLPQQGKLFGDNNLFLGNFSCYGPEVTCAAPGVGIISSVPNRHGTTPLFAPMDGTSMASPAACAALAVRLANDQAYLSLPPDGTRAQAARRILLANARDIGLDAIYQGRGLISA